MSVMAACTKVAKCSQSSPHKEGMRFALSNEKQTRYRALITRNALYMAFITIPVFFIDEEDEEEKKLIGKKSEPESGFIRVNTVNICTYHEAGDDDMDTVLHMVDGTDVIVPLPIDDFENMLNEVENIIKLNAIGQN
jgi:hypothetical protein